MRLGSAPTVDTRPPRDNPRPRSEKELAEALQRELERVGCDPGEIDGLWGAESKEALAEFAVHANVTLQSDQPSEEILAVVSRKADRVCPLECGDGQTEVNARCVSSP